MSEVYLRKTLISLQYSKCSTEIHVFVYASTVAMEAEAYLPLNKKKSETTETCFRNGKFKVAPITQTSVPKLELEADVIGVRL